MSQTSSSASPRYLDYLDSARGIAACMVMVYHFINWKFEDLTRMKIASILFNGSDAVSFFFVLSGFVLSYKYVVLGDSLDIRRFYITRLFRLWPAYFIIVFITALNAQRTDLTANNLTNVFIYDTNQFWEEAFLLRGHPSFDVPSWTLVIELALSFFIPFWVFMAKKEPRLIFWLLLALQLAGDDMFYTHFLLGVAISCLFTRVTDSSFRDTKWFRYRYWLVAAAVILFSTRHLTRIWPPGPTYKHLSGYLKINYFHYTGIAAFIFIIAIINSPRAQKILRWRFLLFLGRISYGIYLCHWFLVVDVFANWDYIDTLFPYTTLAFIVFLLIYSAATILLATILHYTVELPFIRIGKKVAARFQPSLVIQ